MSEDIVYKFDGNVPKEILDPVKKQIVADAVWAITTVMWEFHTEGSAINQYLLDESPDSVAVNAVYNELQSFLRFCVFNSQINLMLEKMDRLGIPIPEESPVQYMVTHIMNDLQNYVGMMGKYGLTVPDFLNELKAFYGETQSARWHTYRSKRPAWGGK
jgi:hypothetical protein